MVAALKNVITGGTASSTTFSSSISSFYDDQSSQLPPAAVAAVETCQFCRYEGCLGCNYFPPPPPAPTAADDQTKKNNNNNVAHEIKPEINESGFMEMGTATTSTSKEMEFWEVIGEDEIQEWMTMMDYHGDSSSSGSGNVHSF
ncbi:hypothetical protein ACH5RR_002243 [Cinchona calisaya]|uniref:Uncharacterized protein n=1 Tax=Cinchona calisaya TaxID=153742 RepID=A0ABD3B5P0_9GENT